MHASTIMRINKDMAYWRTLATIILIIYEVQLLFVGGSYGLCPELRDGIPTTSPLGHAPPVRLKVTSKKVVLDNGILQVTFAVPQGFVTGIRYGGIDNVLDSSKKESQRGYWDIVSAGKKDDVTDELRLVGVSFKIVSQTTEQVEISFLIPRSQSVPLQVDNRYVMLRGSSGFYSVAILGFDGRGYAIFEREYGWPAMQIDQIRAVYKLDHKKFHYMAVSDKIQRIMPGLQDRKSGQPLAYKEAVLLTNPINNKLKGEVDDKYQYSCENKDNKVHGWISFDPPVGVWIITPSDEFRMGGPHKQDLTTHVGPNLLAMFHSTHYAGKNLTTSFQNGEPWKKVFGPYFVHLNSVNDKGDPRTLWGSAKNQMLEEVKNWPYKFPLSQDFPKAKDRGMVAGRLFVNDSGKTTPATSAWVGLASPGAVGSWQHEVKGYQFWSQADSEGNFLIKNIRVGNYSLFAWAPGYIGDYKYSRDVTITPGKHISLGDIMYTPPRNGPTLWEIGVPNRSAAEFFIPEPNPRFMNQLSEHDNQDKYKQYGLWDRYTDLYPKEDIIYKVGASDFRKDWFYAHVLRRHRGAYQPTTWQIIFSLSQVAPNTIYTLRIALASSTRAELQIRINNPDLRTRPIFTTALIGRDNAIARHGIHGLYKLYTIKVQSSLLQKGDNTIFLTQSRGKEFIRGIMYDYLRLEGPSLI